MKNLDKNICVIGLGYVGLTLSISLARAGFKVFGIEKNLEVINCLKKNKSIFYEPNLENELKLAKKNFHFSNKLSKDFNCSVFIITVGTPVNNKKKIVTKYIKKATSDILYNLKKNDLVILRSTVKVGITNTLVRNILNKKKVPYSIAFCPERTAEGNALSEIKNLPQIIGAIDKKTFIRCKNIFNKITKSIVQVSDIETAEMVKITDNTQRDTFFAFSNEIANSCDALNISSKEVILSCNYNYPRSRLFLPGPVSGPCLSKDTYLFAESIVHKKKIFPNIAIAARKTNEDISNKIIYFLKDFLKLTKKKSDIKIGLLGFAFKGKPLTDDTRNSFSKDFFFKIKKTFPRASFSGYDSIVDDNFFKQISLKKEKKIKFIFKGSDIVLILNNSIEFKKLNINKMSILTKNKSLIYDCWSLFDKNKVFLKKNKYYVSFGNHCFLKEKLITK